MGWHLTIKRYLDEADSSHNRASNDFILSRAYRWLQMSWFEMTYCLHNENQQIFQFECIRVGINWTDQISAKFQIWLSFSFLLIKENSSIENGVHRGIISRGRRKAPRLFTNFEYEVTYDNKISITPLPFALNPWFCTQLYYYIHVLILCSYRFNIVKKQPNMQ